MDKKLATYLYSNETLYSIGDEGNVPSKDIPSKKEATVDKEVAQVENKEKAEPILKVEKPTIQPEVSTEEVELAIDLANERVFKMKTQYLFVFHGLNNESKDFLLKILQALGLSFTKVDLLDIEKSPLVDFKETIYDNTIKNIVFFGEKSGKDFLPKLGLPLYEVKTLKNIQFVYSEELSVVSQNKENQKRKLWEILKETFQN